MKDTGRGKLSALADLSMPDGSAALRRLVGDADIFLQAYRPGSLAGRGFGPADVAGLRPGILYGSLSAYGDLGPWASRRGFDSLVQTATGFNVAEAQAAGVEGPRELPCQALDHASGYLPHGAHAAGERRRQLAGAGFSGRDRALDLESGSRGKRFFLPASFARRCRKLPGGKRHTLWPDARYQACRTAVSDARRLGAAGSTARQRSTGLAFNR